MNDLLSFCCVSYNHAQYIEECIKSIWNQDYKNIEILTLDDGSSDNSAEILKKLKEISPCPMTVIIQKNSGNVGKNYNKLINLAKGKYITVLSCDDKLVENTIQYKINCLNNDKQLAYICNIPVIKIDSNSQIIKDTSILEQNIPKTSEEMLQYEYNLGAYLMQGAIYRKNIVDAIGAFDEDLSCCDDIVFRTKMDKYLIENKEYTFIALNTAGVYYRIHANNINKNIFRQVKGVADYLQRYWKNSPNPKTYNEWYTYATYYEPFKTLKLTLSHPRLRNPKYIYLWLFMRYKWCKSNLRKYLIDRGLYKPKAK